ncbi:MAG: TerC family protein [Planctomycetes bacterium]|nr:TerC family protein [Planctomycetota bacterium]
MLLHSRASFKSGTVTVSAWIPGLGPLSCPAPLPCLAAVAPAAGTIHYGHWIAFAVMVAVLLTLDLTVFHKKSHEPSLRESAFWTCFWAGLALSFNVLVWWWLGGQPAIEFLTGYLVEWSLSMDNVFVFAVVFGYFGVPLKYQYRVLFWGILGAVLMRLSFVLLGAELVERYKWVLWLFGAFLVYTGIKLAWSKDEHEPGDNRVVRTVRRFIPVSTQPAGDRFFVREGGKLLATPLFLVLLVVESTDVLFAVDSVPAILGVVTPGTPHMRFIAFTSNVFAILGLRALYFLLAGVMDLFRFLNYGLAAVLIFVGGKMIAEASRHNEWLAGQGGWDPHAAGHLIHPALSLAVIVGLIGTSVVASLAYPERGDREVAGEGDDGGNVA